MKQEIFLYIADQEIDFNEAPDILYTYKITDLTNPTVVYNSYSKTVTIPGTPNNNRIFGGIWNLNREQMYGGSGTIFFDPSKKSSFVIYLNGEIYESGYAKLTNITREDNNITYELELYGGLGSMLYNLSYKGGSEGDDTESGKLKLSDLYYRSDDSTVNESNEFNFKINKDTIWEAWKHYTPYASDSSLWHYINFMPAYNGYPEDFSTDKALINWNKLPQGDGLVSAATVDGTRYTSYQGYSLATLPQDITEWEAKDLRSYLQRPVLRVSGLFKAIQNYVAKEENGGYDLRLDSDFFNTENQYYDDAWITLPLLTEYESTNQSESSGYLVSSGSTTGGSLTDKSTGLWTNFKFGVSGLSSIDKTGIASVEFTPMLNISANTGSQASTYYLANKVKEIGRRTYRAFYNFTQIYYQLLGYDENDCIVASSDVKALYTDTYREMGFKPEVSKSINGVNGYFSRSGSTDNFLFTSAITLTATCNTIIDHFEIKVSTLSRGYSATLNYTNNLVYKNKYQEIDYGTIAQIETGAIQNKGINSMLSNLTIADNGKIRSGNIITKNILLDTEYSPAEYLLGYCKQFGLYFYKEPDTNVVHILDRNTFYDRNEVVNLEDYIDKSKPMSITPVSFENKYYDFHLEAQGGEFEDAYENTNSTPYGMKRVNTGYNFNRESKDLFENNCYHGALECLEKSRYNFENPDGKGPFLWDGTKYNLYYSGISETTEMELKIKDWGSTGWINEDHKYYDVFPKVQFHDTDNKPFDGSNCLVFYLGTDYYYEKIDNGFYWVSDDVPEMDTLNDGESCWLVSNSAETATISGYSRTFAKSSSGVRIAEKYTTLPHFGRNYINNQSGWILRSWDFGAPRTTYIPDTVYRESATMYNAFWKDFISDMYNVNTRVLTCYVRLTERPNPEWLRRFYWFDNAIWRLNEISDWNITSFETTKMEFVKVQDVNNYKNEKISTAYTAYITSTASTIPYTGETIQVSVSVGDGGGWYLEYDPDIVTSEIDSSVGDKTFNVTISANSGTARNVQIVAIADNQTTLTLQQAANINHRVWLEFNSNGKMTLNVENYDAPENLEITLEYNYRGVDNEETVIVPSGGSVVLDDALSVQGCMELEAIYTIRFEDTGEEAQTLYNDRWYYFDSTLTKNALMNVLISMGKDYVLDDTEWGEPYSE